MSKHPTIQEYLISSICSIDEWQERLVELCKIGEIIQSTASNQGAETLPIDLDSFGAAVLHTAEDLLKKTETAAFKMEHAKQHFGGNKHSQITWKATIKANAGRITQEGHA